MARAAQFQRTLEELFQERAHWLLNVLREPRLGPPPKFGRKKVDRAIESLQQLASDALAPKLARAEFAASVAKRKRWHVKGWGRQGKRRLFNKWYDRHIPYKRCVYVFWNRRHCVYVGKTKGGAGRPSSHFDKFWFNGISRIDIYALRGKRSLPSIECLAIHRFQPRINKNKAQSSKWTKKCPLCRVHRDIKDELRSVFAMRRASRKRR